MALSDNKGHQHSEVRVLPMMFRLSTCLERNMYNTVRKLDGITVEHEGSNKAHEAHPFPLQEMEKKMTSPL